MTSALLIGFLATGLVIGQAAAPPAQGQGEASPPMSSAEISQLRAKAGAGDPAAQLALGRAYEEGNSVPQSDEEAANWYRKAAAQGNAPALNNLGLMYQAGRGVEKDQQTAFQLWQKAASQKYATAMFNLGAAYYNGNGVAVNNVSAYAWFLLAQDAGNQPAADAVKRMGAELHPYEMSAALEKIAEMYEKGDDLPKNPGEAIKWYRRALQGGETPVLVKLANLLVQGQDYDEARHLCEEAAKQKYSPGAYCVGVMYERGLGVTESPVEAAKWFNRAAEMGLALAMLRLGEMYWKGSGVRPDRISACAFIFLASSADIPEAKQDRASCEREMNSKDMERAKKKAIEWAKRHQLERANGHPLVSRRKEQSPK